MRAVWIVAGGITLAIVPHQGVKTIAMESVGLPRNLGALPGSGERFDALITATLHAEGFRVVPAAVSESIWIRLRDSIGGYFDTYTGTLIEAKFAVVHGGTLRELKVRYQVDGWLHPLIKFVGAPFTGGKVKWHGTEQTSGAAGGLGGLLFGTKRGSVPALSLFVSLEDTEGKEVYAGVGGIELTTQIKGDRFVDVPRPSLLVDGARNVAAVHLALDSLPVRVGARPGP